MIRLRKRSGSNEDELISCGSFWTEGVSFELKLELALETVDRVSPETRLPLPRLVPFELPAE